MFPKPHQPEERPAIFPTDLSDWIKTQAKSLGFDAVGIAPATALTEEADRLQTWLSAGLHAEMAWMATHADKRPNPQALLPGAQSVVCVGLNYFSAPSEVAPGLKVARYARGRDYHKLIRKRLTQLLKRIQERVPEARGRAITDSAPLLERAMAVRAGLGWQGKHSNLITRSHGSWLLLGELLLTLELAPEPHPVPDLCGRCRRCIDACPTQAIAPPYTVDANQCIAYWTIEAPPETPIPAPVADNMQGWVFGCDICQEVCPWNLKFQQSATDSAFAPRPWLNTLTPDGLLTLDEATFEQNAAGTPLRRTGLTGLQRNVRAIKTD